MGYDPQIREQALRLYLEGNSLRSIGRILHVHHQSVANWLNAAEQALPEQVADQTPTGTVEIDELFTFIGKKNKSIRSGGSISLQQVDCGGTGAVGA
jgi:transposase-like protein